MRQERGLQTVVIGVLAVVILVMSVGFAAFSTTLNINGTATFTAAKWDVHFVPESLTETSTIKATTKNLTNTQATFTVTLPSPGSTYSFEVDVKNYGTLNAALKSITLSNLTAAQQEYITYTVNYAGTDYTQTTSGLNIALAPNETQTAKVTVTVNYVYPENATDLPTTDQEVTLTAALNYEDVRS
ncbi:MAG: hypothetical protein IJK67_05215 [Bacilli bacterium]|nr:hypothetical protein [Bacilli bacterium]